MGLYNFQPRFVPFILDGRKTHTIRATRANPDKPGNTLHLYTGLRRKNAELLMRVPCIKVEKINIGVHGSVWIEGEMLDVNECEQLALRDGFESFRQMLDFWSNRTNPQKRSRLPFEGQIIHWRFLA